jgi:hypothetical protein
MDNEVGMTYSRHLRNLKLFKNVDWKFQWEEFRLLGRPKI